MKIERLNTFLSTLNFVLLFIGYELTTSLFLPFSSDIEEVSQLVTIPYRAAIVVLSVAVIILNYKKAPIKSPKILSAYWFFWFLFVIRVFYDTNFGLAINIQDKGRIWLYIFAICMLSMFSVQKSINHINLEKAFNLILIGTITALLLSFFGNFEFSNSLFSQSMEREAGNTGLTTISYGHLGVSSIILCAFAWLKKQLNILIKASLVLIIIISFIAMIRSGSRGPLLSLILILFFWLFSQGKNILSSTIPILILIVLVLVYIQPLLEFVGQISPFMEERLKLAIYEGYTSGRDNIYAKASHLFLNSPIWGSSFVIMNSPGSSEYAYSHNIILDSLIALGFIGGIIMTLTLSITLIQCYKITKRKSSYYWIALIFVQQVTFCMLSSTFYYNPLLNILIVFIALGAQNKQQL